MLVKKKRKQKENDSVHGKKRTESTHVTQKEKNGAFTYKIHFYPTTPVREDYTGTKLD